MRSNINFFALTLKKNSIGKDNFGKRVREEGVGVLTKAWGEVPGAQG
jgi:hypothetical protein